jgi:ribosomal-protein-alanine N-acetyltransferase
MLHPPHRHIVPRADAAAHRSGYDQLQSEKEHTMSIETERLILRNYTQDDLEALAGILGDPRTMAFWPEPFSRDAATAWLTKNIERRETSIYGRRAVILKATGQLIGDAGVVRAELNGEERDDLGYILHCESWGCGYASEAARALASHYLHAQSCGSLYANMAHDHVASQRVAERIGMRRVSEYTNPRNRDMLTYLYELR